MRRALALVVLTGLAAALCGCSSGAQESPRSATCDTLQAAVDGAQRQAEVAIADLTADPAASRTEAASIREDLAQALDAVSTEEGELVTRSDRAVGRLARQAARAEAGKPLDGAALGDVRTELLAVVQAAREAC